MPLYENRENAENRIAVSPEISHSLVIGTENVIDKITNLIFEQRDRLSRPIVVAFEGWVGVDYNSIIASLKTIAIRHSLNVECIGVHTVFKDKELRNTYKKPYISDDPGFGWANLDGQIMDIMDPDKVGNLTAKIEDWKSGSLDAVVVYGPGSTAGNITGFYDLHFYFDMTRQPLLWQMWDGKLVPLGEAEPSYDYSWKEYYYCDYYLLHNQKNMAIKSMDYYVEAIDDLKLIPRSSYDTILQTLVEYPVKEVKIFQPGPWGAYRYKDFWDVPGLECNAWNELAGPELSILIDVGVGSCLNMPFVSLMQYADRLVGKYIAETYPEQFPMDIWLDDGYFPKKTPAERISMPIHNHPGTDYVKRHFNEPIGRYETYYIAEAYEGANTWMGYKEHCDLEDWEEECRKSDNLKVIDDWKDYICNWDSAEGDLYLIPPGTAHGHGGNQMVLEMDTCPSIAGTEYSFFQYDFARHSWDDQVKAMTSKPLKMHLEHGFDNEKWRRENWVRENLLARPKVVKWTKDYFFERYSSVSEMPFEIERFQFSQWAANDTEERYMHVLTLVVGERVRIVSDSNPERFTEIDLFQSAVVPAAFGSYKVENLTGGRCTIVQFRWKKG